MTPRGLPRCDAATYVGCSPRKFDDMVKHGALPSAHLIGAKKVWDRIELDEFFETLPRAGGSQNDWENDWDDDEDDD